jgi:SAM-dependent methyltransferase
MPNFEQYAALYDLIYRDKDYKAEAQYVARKLRAARSEMRTILELGSGTGRHGCFLAGMGFDVYGIERSAKMVAIAQSRPYELTTGTFTCDIGDIRTIVLDRIFDAVIALFHVISYQTSEEALSDVFSVAANHLRPGGIFLFDVWHGPAVLFQGPSVRSKEASDERRRVRRVATPELDTDRRLVKVMYEFEIEELEPGNVYRFNEEHVVRYLFPDEVDCLAHASGFEMIETEAFLTREAPSRNTWGVAYLLRRNPGRKR